MRRNGKIMKKYFSQKICVCAALLSLLATALTSWLIMRVQYQRTPEYEEFVTGYTTWTGYYKQGDMNLAYLVIGGILIFLEVYKRQGYRRHASAHADRSGTRKAGSRI